jgi:hypothetical protein
VEWTQNVEQVVPGVAIIASHWEVFVTPIATLVLGGLILTAVKPAVGWLSRAISAQIHTDIKDSLLPDIEAMLDEKLSMIRSELSTNGGTSVKDRVDAIDMRLANVEQQLEIRLLASDEVGGTPV